MINSSLAHGKNYFMFVDLENKLNSSLKLGLTSKQGQFKHNNMFMNRLVNVGLDLSLYNIIHIKCIYVQKYTYTNLTLDGVSL